MVRWADGFNDLVWNLQTYRSVSHKQASLPVRVEGVAPTSTPESLDFEVSPASIKGSGLVLALHQEDKVQGLLLVLLSEIHHGRGCMG